MLRVWSLLAALQGGPSAPPVIVADPGPGPVGRYIADVLARPDTRVVIGDSLVISTDSKYPGSVVVLAKRVVNNGSIEGNLIVVGGDLFLHPRSRVGGEAIAVGGAVYPSLLAEIANGSASYRDFTFEQRRTSAGIELRYADLNAPAPSSPVLPIPSWLTTTIPSYDRSNGLSLSLGPGIDAGRISAAALATYRSQLGAVDPSATARWRATRTVRVDLFAGRGTRSNDGWISSDISNSLNALLAGHDARNWYRADAADLTVTKTLELPTLIVAPRLGGRYERASLARPEIPPVSFPWSFTDKHDPADEMRRPNPVVPTGTMTSAVVGTTVDWPGEGVRATLDTWVEVPIHVDSAGRFTQFTFDGRVTVPTVAQQHIRLELHAVATAGDTAPRQRWAYLGGSGTLSTMDSLLSQGGGELIFADARYVMPLNRVQLPLVGAPVLTLLYRIGGAGPTSLPTMTQIAGVRLSIMLIRAEFLQDLSGAASRFQVNLALTR